MAASNMENLSNRDYIYTRHPSILECEGAGIIIGSLWAFSCWQVAFGNIWGEFSGTEGWEGESVSLLQEGWRVVWEDETFKIFWSIGARDVMVELLY